MKKLLAIALLLFVSIAPARAQQSSPGWSYGYVPTAAEWNFWFGKKSDYPGSPSCLLTGCTFTGPIFTVAASTLGAGINIAPGVAPTSPNNGDVWTTSAGMFVQINGATVGPLASTTTPCSVCAVTNATNTFTAGQTISSNSANALAVGANGLTNPAFNVDASTASSATGLNVKSAAAGAGVAVSVISSGANEALTISSKGSGNVNLNTSGGIVTSNSSFIVTSGNIAGFSVGPNGSTNPSFNVDDSTASAATGLNVKSAAAGGGLAVSVLSSGTNEALTINGKGSGLVSIGNTSTGGVNLAGGGGIVTMPNGPSIGGNAMTFPGSAANVAALNLTDQALTGGAWDTPNNVASGSFTMDCGANPLQWILNNTNASWTITAPTVTTSKSQSCAIRVINGSTAANGAIAPTLAGFSGKSPQGGTFSTSPTQSAASVTFTNSSSTVGWTSNTPGVGSIVFFATTGSLPTNFATATLYYVVSSTPGTSITVASTPGGSAITAGSAGSGTQTGYVPSVWDLNVQAIDGPVLASWAQVQ